MMDGKHFVFVKLIKLIELRQVIGRFKEGHISIRKSIIWAKVS